MKTVARYGVFETNSSSEHAFVVFDDISAQELWENDRDVYLDARDVNWISCHNVERADEFDEDRWISLVDAEDLVRIGTDKWSDTIRDIRENDDWCHDYDDYPDNIVAESFRVVPFGEFYEGYHADKGGFWGEDYENVQEKDSEGRDIFRIVVDEGF